MKNLFFFLILFFFVFIYNKSIAQFSEKQSFAFNGNSYDIFKIKQDSVLANKCSFAETKNFNDEKSFFSSFSSNNFFAITASIVDSTCNPLGLFIKNGQTINNINTNTQGAGTFFSIQPNGVFYINQQNEFNVSSTPDFVQRNSTCKLAIQSGPMLVDNGITNKLFTKGSKNKFFRCGVGILNNKDGKFIVFIKSNQPVNFYDFAELFFSKLGCSYALNLESGTNSSLHFPSHKSSKFSNKIKPCRYFIIDLN